jgi:hypothetical protein
MSFQQQYEQYQGQQPGEQGPNPNVSQADLGQPMDQSGGFPPQGQMGPPGGAGPDGNGQGAGKTTLW